MMVIMPKIEKLLIMTPNQKAVISEHTADELEACQLAIQRLVISFSTFLRRLKTTNDSLYQRLSEPQQGPVQRPF